PFDTSGVDVFVFYWQSNCNGRALNSEIEAESETVYADYFAEDTIGFIFSNVVTSWDTLSIYNSRCSAPLTTQSGPDVWFALKYLKTFNRYPYIVKYAVNGTGMKLAASENDWNVNSSSENYDSLFAGGNSILNNALDSLTSDYSVVGVIGIGGERDAELSSTSFYADFSSFIDSTRIYTQENCPHVYNMIPTNYGGGGAENVTYLRGVFEDIQDDKINCRYVNSDDLTLFPDNVHFATLSNRYLGERLFDQWYELYINN
ncbi:MAG: sialate O-acetylesterase, partial [Melioribacteraceae bacterium]|nr:sialate O-acetylesterase [Melioribacteraceae bacterium]